MNFERILEIGDRARFAGKLSPDDQVFVREAIPLELGMFPQITCPSRMRHPSGVLISGAVVRTFIKCAMVLGARRVLGPKYYASSSFYDRVACDLLLGMTLSHFQHGDPKGAYCCAQCTLAFYPVLKAQALRWVDCKRMASNVKSLIEQRKWRFSPSTSTKLIAWSLQEQER